MKALQMRGYFKAFPYHLLRLDLNLLNFTKVLEGDKFLPEAL